MSVLLRLHRNHAESEYGHTGFALEVGYVDWGITLDQLGQLFSAEVLPHLLAMQPGEWVEVAFSGTVHGR